MALPISLPGKTTVIWWNLLLRTGMRRSYLLHGEALSSSRTGKHHPIRGAWNLLDPKTSPLTNPTRTSPLLHRKLSYPILLIHAVSSLDDAIDTSISCTSASLSSPLLASYLFANPASAKYLSQFIPATLSIANSTPPSLLFGPAYLFNFTPSLSPSRRFTEEMFSIPAAEFVGSDESSGRLAQVLYSEGEGGKVQCEETLPPTDQPQGGAIGFFEQGLLTGGVILLTGVIGTATLLGIYAVPAVMKRLR
jgi:hypothetical protein